MHPYDGVVSWLALGRTQIRPKDYIEGVDEWLNRLQQWLHAVQLPHIHTWSSSEQSGTGRVGRSPCLGKSESAKAGASS